MPKAELRKMRPLRTKLLVNNIATIVISFAIFGVALGWGISKLSDNLESFNHARYASDKAALQDISTQNIQRIREIYGQALESKGHRLLQKDSSSVAGWVEDNSFNELRQFLQKSLNDDEEMIEAAYFIDDHGELKAWQVVSKQYPHGLGLPIVYEHKGSAWRGMGATGKPTTYSDPAIPSILGINAARVTLKTLKLPTADGKLVEEQAYDCAVPVYKRGSTASDIALARKRGEPIGYLRYVLSLKRMQGSIGQERQRLESSLQSAQTQNEQYARQGKQYLQKLVRRALFALIIGGLLVLLIAYGISWITSVRLTRPVIELTGVARRMTEGEYNQPIDIRSDDEIGILADSFREMGTAITRRDEEIRRAERQLSEIFAAVPLGILSVEPGGVIGPRYSGYSEWLLNTSEVAGRDLVSTVFGPAMNGIDQASREAIQGIRDLFGKPEMNWDMARIYFPERIHFKLPPSHPDGDRYLDVTYQPIFQSGNLSRLLIVLADCTAVERAKIAAHEEALHEDKSVLRLMQIKKAPQKCRDGLLQELQAMMEQLQESCTERNEATVARTLHSIKGNARVLGLAYVAELVHGMELKNAVLRNEGKALDWEAIESGLKRLAEEWRESWGFYQSLYPQAQGTAVSTPVESGLENALPLLHLLDEPGHHPTLVGWALRARLGSPMADPGELIRLRASETAKLLKKKVDVRYEGHLPRWCDHTTAQACGEAILHLINNAIAHGIQEKGTLSVRLASESGWLRLQVADDGQGIDLEAIKRSAVEKKQLTQEQADQLSPQEASELVFLSGVSSKTKVDRVSGLGVGLGAVRERIRSLGGEIRVASTSEKGTVFDLGLPLAGADFVILAPTPIEVLRRELQSAAQVLAPILSLNLLESSLPAGVPSNPMILADPRKLALAVADRAGALALQHREVALSLTGTQEHLIIRWSGVPGKTPPSGTLAARHPELGQAGELARVCIELHQGTIQDSPTSVEISVPWADPA